MIDRSLKHDGRDAKCRILEASCNVPARAVVGPLGANLLQKRVADVLELEEVHEFEFLKSLRNGFQLSPLLLLAVRLGLCEGGYSMNQTKIEVRS